MNTSIFIGNVKKQIFHWKHELYTQLAYRLPFIPPYRYVFVLTNLCNMRCKNCFQDKNTGRETLAKEQWIDLSYKTPRFSRVTITGGEPLIFPHVSDVLEAVAKRHQCNLITNGTLLTEEMAELLLSLPKFRILAISIDNLLSSKINIRGYTQQQWHKLENILKFFVRRKIASKSNCLLEIKTLILDDNADELFDIHRYCMETLRADQHTFQFLKGSSLQHSVKTVAMPEIFKPSQAPVYRKFDIILNGIHKIKAYNLKNNKTSFLHPLVADICAQKHFNDFSYLNTDRFEPWRFKSCKFPWSSVHINYDGEVFPCLSVGLGNLNVKTLREILQGKQYNDFLRAIRKTGLFPACNRCGWLRPVG